MRAETDREVAEIHRRGAEELAEQRAEAVQELRGQIGGLSTDLAGRILGRPVDHDDQTVQRSWPSWTSGRPREGSADVRSSSRSWSASSLMLFVLWRYVLPPVGNMVRKRQDEVQRQVDEAEEATRKLEEARGRFDNAVQRAEAEGARIRDDARADATRIREELKAQAEAEVERMLQRGREQLVADRDQAVRGLRTELGGASMELAERVVRNDARRRPRPSQTPSRASCPRSRACRRRGAARARRPAEGPSPWRPYCSPPAAMRSGRPPPGSTSTSTPPGRPTSSAWPTTSSPCVGLLDREHALRRALADPATPSVARGGLADRLFDGKIGRPALDVVSDVVKSRWSRAGDLLEGLESLARAAAFGVAEKDGSLDRVEDELFRFGRILDREPELSRLLSDTATPVDKRLGLLREVLGGEGHPGHRHTARTGRAQPPQPQPRRRGRGAVRARRGAPRPLRRARPHPVRMTGEQEQRLTDSLTRLYGRPISLQVELDPDLLGGLVVRVGGELIDGSVAGRLAAARRALPS